MPGFLESASAILSQSERRVETAAQNVSNVATPGYKRRVDFAELVQGSTTLSSFADLTAGKEVETGSKTDLAITGDGFFAVRSGDELLYTRHGQLSRDGDGRLVTEAGLALQGADGSDIALGDGAFEIGSDGTVLQNGSPVARIGLTAFADLGMLSDAGGGMLRSNAGETGEPASGTIRQGAYEASNVSTGDEMVTIMESLRRAESAQRLVTVYDDLMGRALSAFGQS
jgi:flagellar basal-body rod protein FlgF